MIPISKLRPYFPLIKYRDPILPQIFGSSDRVYHVFEGRRIGRSPRILRQCLRREGYRIVDYRLGLVENIKAETSPIRLGKVLRKKKMFDMLHLYENDPARAYKNHQQFLIVLSRHPYDLLGMSVNRGWKSCFSLKNFNTKILLLNEIYKKSIIFYLCDLDDRNITNPFARVLFGPNSEEIYVQRSPVHGTDAAGFLDTCRVMLQI